MADALALAEKALQSWRGYGIDLYRSYPFWEKHAYKNLSRENMEVLKFRTRQIKMLGPLVSDLVDAVLADEYSRNWIKNLLDNPEVITKDWSWSPDRIFNFLMEKAQEKGRPAGHAQEILGVAFCPSCKKEDKEAEPGKRYPSACQKCEEKNPHDQWCDLCQVFEGNGRCGCYAIGDGE